MYAWPSIHCLFFIYARTRNIKVTRQWKYILTKWDWTELLNKMPDFRKTGSWLSKTALARALTQFGWVNQSVYMEKNGSARRVTYHRKRLTRPSSLFSHVNGSPRFVRKCMKSWLAQGGLGRVVTLLFVTNFLHTGAALVLRVVLQVAYVAGIPKGKGRELWRETTREGGGTHAPHAISRAQIPLSPSPFNACHARYFISCKK